MQDIRMREWGQRLQGFNNFAEPADIVVAISGSGNSLNVLLAIEYANSQGCGTLALTRRDDSKLGPLARLNIQVNAPDMGQIEDVRLMLLHMIAYCFMGAERRFMHGATAGR